jgi:hypothetical protein
MKQNILKIAISAVIFVIWSKSYVYSEPIYDSNGIWMTLAENSTISIIYTPEPSKVVCSEIYLSQAIKVFDQDNNPINTDDFLKGSFAHIQDDVTSNGMFIDHMFCEKDAYYNKGVDNVKEIESKGSSDGTTATSTGMTDDPYVADSSFPEDVTTLNVVFEVCPICNDDGTILDSITWSYSRVKGSTGDGTATDATNSTITQDFRDAWSNFQTTHANGTKCPEEDLAPIPTLSEWNQIFLTLLMLSLVLGFRNKNLLNINITNECAVIPYGNSGFVAFNRHLYKKTLMWVGFILVLGLSSMTLISIPITAIDFIGIIICMPLVAYILHLFLFSNRILKKN